MALRRYPADAPVRTVLIDRSTLMPARGWLYWFQLISDRVQAVTRLDTPYDPASIGAGGLLTVDVPYGPATSGDFVTGVSFSPMTEGGVATSYIRLFGDVKENGVVSVTFLNASGGAIDLDAGTLRIQVERAA